MLNEASVKAVNASKFGEHFRRPLYETYCFANVPGTVASLLGVKTSLPNLPSDVLSEPARQYQTVVLFFIDAFGWRFFERYRRTFPTLARFVDAGTVSKITSQFPSTTAAHVTTIHTGIPVGQSGVHEWFYFEPLVDSVIAPLMFSYAGDDTRDTLLPSGVDPTMLFPQTNVFQNFKAAGIETHIFQSAAFTPSTYTSVVTSGVENVHAFVDFRSGLDDLAALLVSATSVPRYAYFYHGAIDAAGHDFGPDSSEFEAACVDFFGALEEMFVTVAGKAANTAVLMIADHGQTNVNPLTTMYVNESWPELLSFLRTNKTGEIIRFGGSARDLFLYVQETQRQLVMERLQIDLKGRAEVYYVHELAEAGFFGPVVGQRFLNRVGNIVVLPYAGESVFWHEPGHFEQTFFGHHGGLTPDEMDSIFLMLPL